MSLQQLHADKRKAVLTLLKDDEWSQWSDREIARQCGVSKTFVSNLRPTLTGNGCQSQPAKPSERTYTTRHGTTAKMNVGRIGGSGDQP